MRFQQRGKLWKKMVWTKTGQWWFPPCVVCHFTIWPDPFSSNAMMLVFQRPVEKTDRCPGIQRIKTGWWFQIFFIFTPIWGRFPIWLIFFKWVESTNQIKIMLKNWFKGRVCQTQVFGYKIGSFGCYALSLIGFFFSKYDSMMETNRHCAPPVLVWQSSFFGWTISQLLEMTAVNKILIKYRHKYRSF